VLLLVSRDFDCLFLLPDVIISNHVITYRTICGILDYWVFIGPNPDDVISQYTAVIGRPLMPPYWALGFHLCRWGYKDEKYLKRIIKRMRDGKFPYVSENPTTRHHHQCTSNGGHALGPGVRPTKSTPGNNQIKHLEPDCFISILLPL
jgi:hypothetical protein